MPFIVFCGISAFIIQLIVLHGVKNHRGTCGLLTFLGMELFPACIAAHAVITKRPSGILGWKFNVVIGGWIAGAILIGCVLAWVVYTFRSKGADNE